MQRSTAVSMCLALFVLGGCASHSASKPPKAPRHPILIVLTAVDGSGVSGTLNASAVAEGVRIQGRITGLAPGSTHGLHVHQQGDCTAPNAGTIGGHFNPTGSEHGDPVGLVHHAGDIANQLADAQGEANIDVIVRGASIDSKLSDDVIGHSLVVQAGPDDYTSQPDGNGGPAIACGVILKKDE